MSVRIMFLILLLLIGLSARGQIMLNELYYDHPGSDTGYEWLEIHNPTPMEIDLENWKIEKAGTEFEVIFIFPDISILPHDYLVIGETEVAQADLTAVLAFQNGGSATDGVRIVSADSLWSDTVLYDQPNSNNLPDDTGSAGSAFAPDVEAGYSLIRFPEGMDTNNCQIDWQPSHNPSPGTPNIVSLDLEISEAEISFEDNYLYLFTEVHNLSTIAVDNSVGNLDIYFNNEPFESISLPGISGGGRLEFVRILSSEVQGYNQIKLHLNSIYDNNLENNFAGCSILLGEQPICLNELMIMPFPDDQEWLEIFVIGDVDNFVDNLMVYDNAGNFGCFSTQYLISGYLVICDNIIDLAVDYGLSEYQLIQSETLPIMNNSGDALYLTDQWGTIIDSVVYDESAAINGISWERINPYDSNSTWGQCLDPEGHTAGAENSIICGMIDLGLQVSLEVGTEMLTHKFLISSYGISIPPEALLTIYWEKMESGLSDEIEEYIVIVTDSLEYQIETVKPGSGYYQYTYTIFADGDSNSANDQLTINYNQDSLPWVINEIMYHPDPDEPEWLEIKRNWNNTSDTSLWIIADDDSCEIMPIGEYVLVTGSSSDLETLLELYGNELEVYEGLGRLTDSGSQIGIKDADGNIFELFSYDPLWNQSLQGISIERVNPQLPSRSDNWGQSVSKCTPGKQNSIYTELPPASNSLQVNPRVFAPHQGEHTVITYQSTANLNQVKLRIYDLKGRLIRNLADQDFQGSEGYYLWDGRNKNGKISPMGVYVILFESSDSHDITVQKETVVIKR